MIINELSNLFNRLIEQGVDLPRRGWSKQKIGFRLVIDRDGNLVRVEDARDSVPKYSKKGEITGYKRISHETLVLGNTKPPGSGINPCFLWDNAAYLLGSVEVKPKALECFDVLRQSHLQYETEISSPAYSAVCRFLEKWEPDRCVSTFNDNGLDLDKDFKTVNGIFRLQGERLDVHQDKSIIEWWNKGGLEKWAGIKASDTNEGLCLVTGQNAPIARLHEPKIKGVVGAQAAGAAIVSFNCASFESYGKAQGGNSPVSEQATHAYCNALNWLLAEENHHVRLAESTIVFWTDAPQKEDDDEFVLFTRGCIIPASLDAQDSALVAKIAERMKKIKQGRSELSIEDETKWARTGFYILGLSPNNGRLSIRFFLRSSMKE